MDRSSTDRKPVQRRALEIPDLPAAAAVADKPSPGAEAQPEFSVAEDSGITMKTSHAPYLFAVCYFLFATAVAAFAFQTVPPRFMDVFLIGIAFTTARWSWRPAALLYLLSLLMMAWVLPPGNSLAVSEGHDQLRLALYGATSLSIIIAIELAKAGRGK